MASGEDGDITLAGELALGLLEGTELREARLRQRTDPAFGAEVARWDDHLALLFRSWPEIEPPASAQAALMLAAAPAAANDQSARGWKIATWLSGAVAAALALALVMQRPTAPVTAPAAPPEAQVMAVALTGQDRTTPLPAVLDLASGKLRMAGGLTVPSGRSAELWLIVGEAKPVSLGLLHPAAGGLAAQIKVKTAIPAGATLAISVEPEGGSKTGQPTGPVVASGALTEI